MVDYKILICGDRSVIVAFPDEDIMVSNERARWLERELNKRQFDWLECTKVLSDSTALIYNPAYMPYGKLCAKISKIIKKGSVPLTLPDGNEKKLVHSLSVCFSEKYAPDLAQLASLLGTDGQALTDALCSRDYLVCYFLNKGRAHLSPTVFKERPELSQHFANRRIKQGQLVFDGGELYIAPFDALANGAIVGTAVVEYTNGEGNIFCRPGEYLSFTSVTENKFKKLCEKKERLVTERKVNIVR